MTKTQLSHLPKKVVKPVGRTVENAVRALPFVPNKFHEYSWEELEAIEDRRRRILTRDQEGMWEMLASWDGTIWNILILDPLMWACNIIYLLLRFHARNGGIPVYVSRLGAIDDITIIGGFLTFFLVLYVRQNNNRYFSLYGHSMACKGRIFDTATLAKSYLPSAHEASRLIRYMNAAHVAGYTGLSSTYPAKSFFRTLNKNLCLLTDSEMQRMDEINLDKGGAANRELIAWCMNEIHQHHVSGNLDRELAHQFREQILKLRAATGQLFNAQDLPVPFFYVHFICLLTVLYLPIFSISVAYKAGTGADVYWIADAVGGLMVLFQSFFVIGLRNLGQKMSDPYGTDLIDLSVIFFCTFTWRMSNRILEAKFPSPTSADEEYTLNQKRVESLGNAWVAEDVENDVVTRC